MTVRSFAKRVDQLGLRPVLAIAASAAYFYRGQHFSVDQDGSWVNHDRGRTLTSPTPFVNTIDAAEQDAIDYFLYAYTPKPGDVVFDIGAGIGTEARLFSRLVGPKGRVIAIEAHPVTAAALRKNVAGLENVTVRQYAVMDRDADVMIGETDNHVANAIGASGFKVPGRTIDSISAELGLARIDFVKMNIEGAERSAIVGISRQLPRNVCISCHDFLGADTATEGFVRAVLAEKGYELLKPRADVRPWVPFYVYGRL